MSAVPGRQAGKPSAAPSSPSKPVDGGGGFLKRIFSSKPRTAEAAQPPPPPNGLAPTPLHRRVNAGDGSNTASRAPSNTITGPLASCPLTPLEYEEARQRQRSRPRAPQPFSRLHTELADVLADPVCLEYFLQHVGRGKELRYVRFWLAADHYARQCAADKGHAQHRRSDAMAIYGQYLAPGAADGLDIRPELVQAVAAALDPPPAAEATADTSGDAPAPAHPHPERAAAVIPADCFAAVQQEAYNVLNKGVFLTFTQQSNHYLKYCISILTSGTLTLEDIMHNPRSLMGFMELLERDGAWRLAQFWLAVDSYTQGFAPPRQGRPALTPAEIRGDAMALYSQYFSLQAEEPIGTNEAIRVGIEASICSEGGPKVDSFAAAQHMVDTALRQHFLPLYLQSDLFYQHLNELVFACEAAPSTNDPPTNAPASKRDGGDPAGGAGAAGRPGPLVPMRRVFSHSLGYINEWGIYVPDDESATVQLGEDLLAGLPAAGTTAGGSTGGGGGGGGSGAGLAPAAALPAGPGSSGGGGGPGGSATAAFHQQQAQRHARNESLGVRMKSAVGIKRRDLQAEQEMALQVAQMIIQDVYRDMREHKTLDRHLFLRPRAVATAAAVLLDPNDCL